MRNQSKSLIYLAGVSLVLAGCLALVRRMTTNHIKVPLSVFRSGVQRKRLRFTRREEVIGAVKNFFMETYKTDVKVHNIVGNVDAATIFVESTWPVRFYTTAIIPIDLSEEEIMVNQVFTMDGEVESVIRGGLYHLMFEVEFNELDRYLDRVVAENKVVGKTIESIENVGGTGYMPPPLFPYHFFTGQSHPACL
ncbi:DUF1672 family protein [Rossellomorea aquimaris]|uniref:DUF1672 family protein n=1 Tax=Rossellomorea aquimaris TaxID=189382 RepID=UPI000696B2A0|nr:DUF1672 family protein [Rossellomorea aquimaris]